MMQFTKQALLLTMSLTVCFAEHQIDLIAGGVSSSGFGLVADGDYRGMQIINDHFLINGGSTLNINRKTGSPFSQMEMFPFLFDGNLAGVVQGGIHRVSLWGEADLTKDAKKIRFPLLTGDNSPYLSDSLQHRNALGAGIKYGIDQKHIEADGGVLFRDETFDRFGKTDSSLYHERDLFATGMAHGLFLEQSLFAGGSVLLKDDLNSSDLYNWMKTSVEAGTDIVKNKRRQRSFLRLHLRTLQVKV